MTNNIYLETLNKSKIRKDIKIAMSPRREIVLKQKNKCYICERNLNNTMCHFDKIGTAQNELRVLCPQCFFNNGKKYAK